MLECFYTLTSLIARVPLKQRTGLDQALERPQRGQHLRGRKSQRERGRGAHACLYMLLAISYVSLEVFYEEYASPPDYP